MKRIFIYSILLSLLFVSCSEQEETPEPLAESDPIVNQAVFQSTGIATPHCYLIFDDGPTYTNGFILLFSDGVYQEDNVNGASFINTTQNAVALFVMDDTPPTVSTEQSVDVTLGAYALNDETGAYFGINAWDDTYTQNGNTYGEPDGATHIIEQGLNGGGVLVINSVTIDYTARTGTIDAEYQMLDGNRNYISGTYSGTFEILNEF